MLFFLIKFYQVVLSCLSCRYVGETQESEAHMHVTRGLLMIHFLVMIILIHISFLVSQNRL